MFQRCDQSYAVQASMIILLLNVAAPFCKSTCLLKVDHLVESAIYRFQVALLRFHVILPHSETQPKLSVPKVVDAPFHDVELAALVAFKSLCKHPLLKLTIEDKSLCVPLCEVVRDASVLFHEHHRITS